MDKKEIENQEIIVMVNNFNIHHFQRLGYDAVFNQPITIPARHLPEGSGIKILVQCCYCGKKFYKSYRRYLETQDDICCDDCKKKKMMKTSLEKYGNVCSLRNPEVQKKSLDKNMKNLGVQYPFQNKEILKKCLETQRERYANRSCAVSCSKQQRHFYELYGGVLNYYECPYFLDILLDNNIYFEYDGSGHRLSVSLGSITDIEFDKHEKSRRAYLENMGYKEFRYISYKDKLFSDSDLIKIKDRAYDILLKQGYKTYIYDADNDYEVYW